MKSPILSENYADPSQLSSTNARDITDKIRAGLEGIYQLIIQAYRGRAWISLGYATWDEYVRREFGNQALRPPLEERTEVVQSLRDSGLSVRAIAASTDLGVATVHREIEPKMAGVPVGTPEAERMPSEQPKVLGIDGKEYSSSKLPGSQSVNGADSGVLDAVLDASAESAGVKLLDPQERHQRESDRTEKILGKFHGSESAALEQTMFLAEKIAGLVSPVTAEIDVSRTIYGDVTKDIAAAIRQFAHVAKTLAGAQTEFENKKLLNVVIDDLGCATDDLASTVAQLEDKKQ